MLLRKIIRFHQEHGFKALLIKIRVQVSLLIKKWIEEKLHKEKPLHALVDQRFESARQIHYIKTDRKTLRLNLLLDHFEGFPLVLASLFANRHQVPLRIITRASLQPPSQFFRYLEKQKIPFPKVEFFSDYGRAVRLETSEKEIYVVTSWQTAHAIKSSNFKKPYFYLREDVPHDVEEKIRFEELLSDPSAILIPPCEPAFPSEPQFAQKSKYRLLLHSPSLFFIGLQLIEEAFSRGILDPKEWDIHCLGESLVKFSTGLKPKMHKSIGLNETFDLGIFLHPTGSYRPLECISFGGVALTNISLKNSPNIIVEEISSMIRGFESAVSLVKAPDLRKANYERTSLEKNWEHNLKDALEKMEAHVF